MSAEYMNTSLLTLGCILKQVEKNYPWGAQDPPHPWELPSHIRQLLLAVLLSTGQTPVALACSLQHRCCWWIFTPPQRKKKKSLFFQVKNAYWPITKSHRTGGGATSKASKSWSLCIVSCRTSLISCRPMTCQGLEMPWKSGIELGKITMLGNQIESQIWDFIPY